MIKDTRRINLHLYYNNQKATDDKTAGIQTLTKSYANALSPYGVYKFSIPRSFLKRR